MSPSPPLLARPLLVAIRAYQLVSRWTPPHCRFHPTCSQYAADALTHHGAWHGSWLAARRLARCHPWNPGGHDPVPHTLEAPHRS